MSASNIWFHCNRCYSPAQSGKQFSLTSCGHIFCSDCLPIETLSQATGCLDCGCNCQHITLGRNSLDPKMQCFFRSPEFLLKENYRQMRQVLGFQNVHMTRLVEFFRNEVSNVSALRSEFHKVAEKVKEYERENEQLRAENATFKQQLSNPNKVGIISPLSASNTHQPVASVATNANSLKRNRNPSGDTNAEQSFTPMIKSSGKMYKPGGFVSGVPIQRSFRSASNANIHYGGPANRFVPSAGSSSALTPLTAESSRGPTQTFKTPETPNRFGISPTSSSGGLLRKFETCATLHTPGASPIALHSAVRQQFNQNGNYAGGPGPHARLGHPSGLLKVHRVLPYSPLSAQMQSKCNSNPNAKK